MVEIGARIFAPACAFPNHRECFGRIARVPASATGRIDAPVRIARSNAPSLNGSSSPVGRARPLGKHHHGDATAKRALALGQARAHALALAASQRDVATEAHRPPAERLLEQRLLRDPPHVPRQERQQKRIRLRLVVRDDDVAGRGDVGRRSPSMSNFHSVESRVAVRPIRRNHRPGARCVGSSRWRHDETAMIGKKAPMTAPNSA